MANTKTVRPETIKIVAKKVVIMGENKPYVTVPGLGALFITKAVGVKEGDILTGQITLGDAHYDTDENGAAMPNPFDRVEVMDYTSSVDLRNVEYDEALASAKVNTIKSTKLSVADLVALAGGAVKPQVVAVDSVI